ncbi:molybdopterin-dependent oxidoreductase [Halohasta litorea]|uniref:Molybdopterin-dependent oxidoreductase n=1 Tax=Halohasta litorea TaxID=869891 RepID=A0ABD6D3G1_9EURY|nr:molybdopterin-dependent oxidoreductase [Halohasta litorea]
MSRLGRLTEGERFWRVVTAALAAVAAVAGSYAYAGFSQRFVVEPAAAFLTETTPAILVNTVLDSLGNFAQPARLATAAAISIAVVGFVVWLALELEVVADRQYLGVPLTAAGVWLLAAAVTGAYVAAVAAAIPATLVVGIISFFGANDPLSVRTARKVDDRKRATLKTGVGVAGLAGASYFVGQRRTPEGSVQYLGGGSSPPRAVQELLDSAADAAFDLPDAPGLISEIGSFYTVDIATVAPMVDSADWSLTITGAVENDVEITYDELREMEADHFYSTLRCVGEDLNARKMDNAVWTGVPLSRLLEEAGPQAEEAISRAEDGYFVSTSREELAESYVVYGMNGRLLPREHGHPVRLMVPGNWGEVNTKWVSELEFTDEPEGYWENRGWTGTGEVRQIAKIWSVDRSGEGVTVGGHAYACCAAIDRVEVSIDGGESWTTAELTEPLGPVDGWQQWRYTFDPEEPTDLVARAVDADGNDQPEMESDQFPDGPSGWVSRTIQP